MSGKCPVNRQSVRNFGELLFCKRLIYKMLSHSAPCGTRTHDPRIRNPLLYPAELRALLYGLYGITRPEDTMFGSTGKPKRSGNLPGTLS
jgi:hypothetical protein